MKREYPETPLVGVGAIIIEEDRVALVRRGHPPLKGRWSIPGGVLEVGETLRTAVVREAFEETALTIEPGELLGVFERHGIIVASRVLTRESRVVHPDYWVRCRTDRGDSPI